ncbi:MAG: hypothetical protein CVV58_01605 [Tenericutes bacterium HGW-Tenericutes-3]|nr:MAG: hypothetical protein CVV58_01605 [Tenericutes bacterium HGW-Tenericutes-3]
MKHEKTSLLIGCFYEEEVIAIANLSVQERHKIDHKASIGLSVKKAYWNQGIGTKIMEYFIKYSIENKQLNILNLEVRTDNERAIKIYKNLGFNINDYPNAYKQYSNQITLPLHTLLTNSDIEYISVNINTILN